MERERITTIDEELRAVDKRTGKYIDVIKRTIDDGDFPFPTCNYLDKNYNLLDHDCVKNLDFDVEINWELRRYQIVKDLLSNNFQGKKMDVVEVDNAIFTADLIINRLKDI